MTLADSPYEVGLEKIDPRTALILIPCSGTKATGGKTPSVDAPPNWSYELRKARAQLRQIANIDEDLVMPAWMRYTGYLYEAAKPFLAEAVSCGANIEILSGGYGLVHAIEEIGMYDRLMNPKDWPRGLIEKELIAEATRLGVKNVVCFAAKTTGYATIIRRTKWQLADIARVVLVTANGNQSGALRKVPHDLGLAFGAYWSGQADRYPVDLTYEVLL